MSSCLILKAGLHFLHVSSSISCEKAVCPKKMIMRGSLVPQNLSIVA